MCPVHHLAYQRAIGAGPGQSEDEYVCRCAHEYSIALRALSRGSQARARIVPPPPLCKTQQRRKGGKWGKVHSAAYFS